MVPAPPVRRRLVGRALRRYRENLGGPEPLDVFAYEGADNAWNNLDHLFNFGALWRTPRWSHSREWGYAPTGGLGLILVIVVILVLLGRI